MSIKEKLKKLEDQTNYKKYSLLLLDQTPDGYQDTNGRQYPSVEAAEKAQNDKGNLITVCIIDDIV
jgi:hypothetical protein